ncbi:hypothetical protein BJV85_003181 [Clostridium acetobutylicum]|uniref:hypothetical protein n=1 Tax=Clostridium TaxID=1485 RepID=UPI000200A723|nr:MULTISPECIES: hypothetical protein [Clostridium]ADZ19878.1 Conserved hypothetical protein [Clostridium acetobutylicum EA 2018]AEI31461.1 hypothetical protein SMB_G0844 [Clostridium acetobutylicum DSM 1731]AWV80522.1 hypothetical protein DK921_10535 [Clostridium acetobutylicum]MBC2392712.1 hypothetical protein [Clostridium acetobutylicum]MBC2584540.1 hypothetical protein [Clostridium acetobutylicum]
MKTIKYLKSNLPSFFKKLTILSPLFIFLLTGCNLNSKSVTLSLSSKFYSNDKAVSINYNPTQWQEGTNRGQNAIALKKKNTDALVGGLKCNSYSENLTEDEYISALENTYKKNSIEGSTSTSYIKVENKKYAVVHSRVRADNSIIDSDTLVVINGDYQYEFKFEASDDSYKKYNYRDMIMNMFKTLKVYKKASPNPDTKNINIKDLNGSWGIKNSNSTTDKRLVLNNDSSFKIYKQSADDKNVITGTYIYSKDNILTFTLSKVINDGQEVPITASKVIKFKVTYLKGNTIHLTNTSSLSSYSYVRLDN